MAASAMIKSCWVSCVRYHYRPKLQDSQVGIKTRCNFHKIVVTRSDYAGTGDKETDLILD